MSSANQGCLGFLFRLVGAGGEDEGPSKLPYRLRQDFLSRAELSFYHVLRQAVGDQFTVCCKVGLTEIFWVAQQEDRLKWRNKIHQKHVDFLVCDVQTMQPVAGVELDDASHERADRKARDWFVDQVFEQAGLPLIHVPARRSYAVSDIQESLRLGLATRTGSAPAAAVVQPAPTGSPTCPRCDVPMVLHTARRGANSGSKFWGCPNYPKCRHTLPLA